MNYYYYPIQQLPTHPHTSSPRLCSITNHIRAPVVYQELPHMYVQIYFPWPSSAIHHKRGYCWLGSPEHLPATSVLLFIINHTWTLRYDNNFHTTKLLLLLLIRLANVCSVLCSLKHVLCFINWSERHPSTSTRSRYLRAGGSLRQLDRVLANGSRQQYRLDSWQCTTTTGCCPP